MAERPQELVIRPLCYADVTGVQALCTLPAAKDFVRQNYAKYEAMMVDSLTLKPFTGSLQPTASALTIGFAAVPGSVTAITLDPAR